MTERHAYYYLHVDSRHRTSGDNRGDFRVYVPQTLTNCSRVALKSFSIENSFSNLTGNYEILYWVEFYRSGAATDWSFKVFYIDLQGNGTYIGNTALKDLLNEKFGEVSNIKEFQLNGDLHNIGIADSNHKFATEAAMDIHFDFNETTFKYSILTSTATVHKLFAPFKLTDENLWTHMGFRSNDVMTVGNIPQMLSHLNSFYGADYGGMEMDVYLINNYTIDSLSSLSAPNRTLTADFASKLENHISELYVCSKELSNDALRTLNNGQTVITHILENVVNNVPKFSYLHKEINFPSYHRLPQKNIQSFSIQILDANFNTFDEKALPDFKLVLQFEQTLEIEYHKEMFQAYNLEGYKQGHPVLN